LPGASATATAAAWAKRLDDPMTKVSKVYRGFSGLSGMPVVSEAAPIWLFVDKSLC